MGSQSPNSLATNKMAGYKLKTDGLQMKTFASHPYKRCKECNNFLY